MRELIPSLKLSSYAIQKPVAQGLLRHSPGFPKSHSLLEEGDVSTGYNDRHHHRHGGESLNRFGRGSGYLQVREVSVALLTCLSLYPSFFEDHPKGVLMSNAS